MDKWLKFVGEFPGNLLVCVPTGIIMTEFLPISYVYQEAPVRSTRLLTLLVVVDGEEDILLGGEIQGVQELSKLLTR